VESAGEYKNLRRFKSWLRSGETAMQAPDIGVGPLPGLPLHL